MESKQFTSDDLCHSPQSNEGFLVDRFIKKSNHLNIPDTIPENCSAELSEDGVKMEAQKMPTGSFSNEKVNYNEFLNKSINTSVDNSYIRQCERKLLGNSSSDAEKSTKSDKSTVNKQLMQIPRTLEFSNDTISTPPSQLRKEISLLRSEMAEAHEFHDFEIQVLKEEKLSDIDSDNYLELFEKYSTLMELYTTLKTEYDEYRKEQEKMRQELHSKTADCLESLCSQIEASDSSLNFSNVSFVSFSGGIRSSTMMEDISEVEATVVHDGTVLANDPLSITHDGVFKTPMQTPLKIAKKLFPQDLNSTAAKPILKEVKEIISKCEITTPLHSEYNIHLLNLETALYDKTREVEDLEQRLFKVEDLSSVLQNDFERITSIYAKENSTLKENLSKKTKELDDVTQKLFTETISLNPSLRDSLTDIPAIKLLVVFIETIMESCKKIQNEEIAKHNAEKAEWELTIENLQNKAFSQLAELEDLKKKLSDAESTILTRNEEIRILESHVSSTKQSQEDFASAAEALSELKHRLTLSEAEKTAAENRYRELETIVENLKQEINVSEKLRLELQAELLSAGKKKSEIEGENVHLKLSCDTLNHQVTDLKNIIQSNELEIIAIKEKLISADGTILQLKSQLSTAETKKKELLNQCSELEENNRNLRIEITDAKKLENSLEYENIRCENYDLKQKISDSEKMMAKVKAELELAKENQMNNFHKVEELIKEIEQLKKENSVFSKAFDTVEESQRSLADVLLNVKDDSDLPSDRITKLIENSSKLQEPVETRETKIISVFMETITKTCKGVQNELIKQFDSKQFEWEIQRKVDLNLITNLQDQIQFLNDKSVRYENQISEISAEKEDLIKLLENYKNKISQAEESISNYSDVLKQTKEDLAVTDGIVAGLKSQLELVLSENVKVKEHCQKLEETILNLQSEVESKKTIIKELDELKIIREKYENENDNLRQRSLKSEELVIHLKKNLEKVEEEKGETEQKVLDLQNEINLLKKNQEALIALSEKLEILEKNNKNLIGILSEVHFLLEMPDSILTDLMSGNFENKKIFSERIGGLIKAQTQNQITWQEAKIIELEKLKKTCESLEEKLLNAEKTISNREEEFLIVQSDLLQTREDFSAAKRCLSDLESRLDISESERKEIENQCQAMNKVIESLRGEIETSEKLKTDLQMHVSSIEEQKFEINNENVRLKELCDSLRIQIVEDEGIIAVLKLNESSYESKLVELEDLRKNYQTLEMKLSETEKIVFAQKEEIQVLQSDISHLSRHHAEFASTKEVLSDQLISTEIEKTKAEKRCRELEENIKELKREIEFRDNLQKELKTQKSEVEVENTKLKLSLDALKAQMAEAEKDIGARNEEIRALKSFESELTSVKKNLVSADERILHLSSQLKLLEVEKSEMEIRCSELRECNENLRVEITSAKNIEDNPVYENIQIENGNLKQRIFESEKLMTELKNELELAKKDQMNNICKVEELIREIEELKRENSGFSNVLITIEETQKNLADVLLDVASDSDSDLPSDKITKLISKNSKLTESVDTRETKIMTDFVKTITKTCREVQNEMIKKFDNKKLEWENQKVIDLQNLQDQIKLLTKKNIEHDNIIKQTKDDLAVADETILQLKSQLSLIQNEKIEIEIRCQKLENDTLSLQAEIDTKETIIKGLDELKIVREKIENENSDLKEQILKSEEVIIHLRQCLEETKEEQMSKDVKMQDLQNEINFLKTEQENIKNLSKKLENLEKSNKNLLDVISDIQSHLNMPEDILTELLSGSFENKKIFSEKINSFTKTQTEGLKMENKNLKLGIDNMKEKIKELTKLMGETANDEQKEVPNINSSHSNSISSRTKYNKNIDICVRRLDKLEEINYNLTELLTRILTMTKFPDLDKLKLCSVRDFPNITKTVVAHFEDLESKLQTLKEENTQLDEECETYANIIKDLKKEATALWKENKDRTEAMEEDINRLKEERTSLENVKQDLLAKISKLEGECEKLKSASKTDVPVHSCTCGKDSKKINELKRIILMKEQKLLELQDLEAQSTSFKSQIEYLKNALEKEKKKIVEEKEKNTKLQSELKGMTKNKENDNKKAEENQILDELRMRGSISGGIVQEFVDKEKMRKLSKDIGILKELCRARYAEIKRLEAVNTALRNGTPKNSNQMDSPIRSRGYNTRSKNQVRDFWRTEINGKENSVL